MKHLIETANPSGLPIVEYDRIILNSTTNDVIVGGGVDNANIIMFSVTGYRLYGIPGDDGQINYPTFEYAGTEEYNGKEYFKYSLTDTEYVLAPTRKITKVAFPFDDYYYHDDGIERILPLSHGVFDSLYGFTSVPENKVVMKHRTDIGTNAHGYSCVDLGLTSGTLWATMNVGATSETDYGSYFQWGDTLDKRDADCSWESYKYCKGTENSLTKYNNTTEYGENPDNKRTLDLVDDAARVHMGGDWRMPTTALMEELISETNNMSATVNGVNGWKFTSKTDPNKYIFIPASGYRLGSEFNNNHADSGNTPVWSSSLFFPLPYSASYLNFDSNSISADYHDNRYYGCVVRGVL